jgi:hypothetical protein
VAKGWTIHGISDPTREAAAAAAKRAGMPVGAWIEQALGQALAAAPERAAAATVTPKREGDRGKKHGPARDQREKRGGPRRRPSVAGVEQRGLFGDLWGQLVASEAQQPEEAVEEPPAVVATPVPSALAVAPAKRKAGRPRKTAPGTSSA